MDEKRLKEIEERAAKATPGPWTTAGIDRRPYISNTLRVQDTNFWNLANFINAEDASFIAASRQDIPDLLAEIKRLREALRDIAHGPVGYWNEPQHREEVIGHFMKIATEALK